MKNKTTIGRTGPRKPGRPPSEAKAVKTSISLSDTVYNWAIGLAKAKGFENSFSSYIADLIRLDKLRQSGGNAFNPDQGN